jgi:hypothetical protein
MMGLFPDLRFIHIYRDPRDVLASYRGFSWGGDDFAIIARRLAGIYGRWFTIREQLPPDSYLEMGLEALAAEPTATLNAVCEFIGLDFEESLTSIPLDKVNAGRWKRDIPAREWEMAEPCLREFIEAYGYATG